MSRKNRPIWEEVDNHATAKVSSSSNFILMFERVYGLNRNLLKFSRKGTKSKILQICVKLNMQNLIGIS